MTLQHRDFRIDNILFSPANDEAYVVDWQTLGVGPGAARCRLFDRHQHRRPRVAREGRAPPG